MSFSSHTEQTKSLISDLYSENQHSNYSIIGKYFREKHELWLPNGTAAPKSIELSKLTDAASFNSSSNHLKSTPNALDQRFQGDETLQDNSSYTKTNRNLEDVPIKLISPHENIGTSIKTSANGASISNGFYEPSFNIKESVKSYNHIR